MRNAGTRLRDGFDVLHEAGQVFQLPPERINLLRRAVDDDRLFQFLSLAALETGMRLGHTAGSIAFN